MTAAVEPPGVAQPNADGQVPGVRLTDQAGRVLWQRSTAGPVLFPSAAGDAVGNCACRLDAIDSAGGVVASVDLQTWEYSEG